MNKKTLLEIKDYTQHTIIYFSNQYENEKISETSFSNWNARDVIGHINSWLQFSENIITLIQSKKSITDAVHVDVTSFNKASYEKYKNESLEKTIHESETRLETYGNAAALFDETDLLQKDSSFTTTGFDFPAWKYIAMDLLYHPTMHMLYYYVKHGDYDEFAGSTSTAPASSNPPSSTSASTKPPN